MQGVVFRGRRSLELLHFDDPIPADGGVVLEMKASGFCGSDLHHYRGELGASLMGKSARSFRKGDRVMVYHYEGCKYCDSCRTGWVQMCDRGAHVFGHTAHGGHAP